MRNAAMRPANSRLGRKVVDYGLGSEAAVVQELSGASCSGQAISQSMWCGQHPLSWALPPKPLRLTSRPTHGSSPRAGFSPASPMTSTRSSTRNPELQLHANMESAMPTLIDQKTIVVRREDHLATGVSGEGTQSCSELTCRTTSASTASLRASGSSPNRLIRSVISATSGRGIRGRTGHLRVGSNRADRGALGEFSGRDPQRSGRLDAFANTPGGEN